VGRFNVDTCTFFTAWVAFCSLRGPDQSQTVQTKCFRAFRPCDSSDNTLNNQCENVTVLVVY